MTETRHRYRICPPRMPIRGPGSSRQHIQRTEGRHVRVRRCDGTGWLCVAESGGEVAVISKGRRAWCVRTKTGTWYGEACTCAAPDHQTTTSGPSHARGQGDEKVVQLLERLAEPTCTPGRDGIVERFLRGIEVV